MGYLPKLEANTWMTYYNSKYNKKAESYYHQTWLKRENFRSSVSVKEHLHISFYKENVRVKNLSLYRNVSKFILKNRNLNVSLYIERRLNICETITLNVCIEMPQYL